VDRRANVRLCLASSIDHLLVAYLGPSSLTESHSGAAREFNLASSFVLDRHCLQYNGVSPSVTITHTHTHTRLTALFPGLPE